MTVTHVDTEVVHFKLDVSLEKKERSYKIHTFTGEFP